MFVFLTSNPVFLPNVLKDLSCSCVIQGKFSLPAKIGPGAHPAFSTMGTGLFPRGKAAGRLCWPLIPHLAPRLKEEKSCTLLSHWAFMACSTVKFIFYRV